MARSFGIAPSTDDFERLARTAISRIPAPFAEHLVDVTIGIEEFADEDTLEALGIDDPWDLSGLYHGRPIDEESIWDSGQWPSHITLYRQPLLAEWCESRVTLEDLVNHVVIHEVGHHFGLSDDQMHAIEMQAD